jgi:serine/threonine-protein kinase
MTSDFAGRPNGAYQTLGPGSRVAGYVIEEQIGAGGMAVVFRARDEVLGRLAAVKVMAPALAGDQEFRARFLRESRAVATVDEPHVIPVYAAGEASGLLYIATRFVAGGDLATVLRRAGGTLEPGRAAALVLQVASALDAAHAVGLVHRDVKPGNILVETLPGRAEQAYLSDFGLSKGSLSSTGLTSFGQFLGTPDYCPPEQLKGGPVDGRADQYALACVAFVLLAGTVPFRREDAMAVLFAHYNEPAPSLTTLRPGLTAAVDTVVVRGLAKSPADRYRTCGDFAAALGDALAALPQAATAAGRQARPGDEDPSVRADRVLRTQSVPVPREFQVPGTVSRPYGEALPDRGRRGQVSAGRKRAIASGLAAAIIAGTVAAVLALQNPGGPRVGKSAAEGGNTPSSLAGSEIPARSTSPATTTPAATTAYTLGTPATAGGYPMGQNPVDLVPAITAARTVILAMTDGTENPSAVAASYQLPASQVITFTGFQGTFTPANLAAALASVGTDQHMYAAGPHGGTLGCANAKPGVTGTSGAICVWSTASTLGVTEFFSSSGPETLMASQATGAEDTVKLRADVEQR